VEAGLRLGDLNRHLRDTGLFFSVDPGTEEATLGGMAATRASGTNSVRYGTMRDNVINLTAVMGDGRIMRSAGRARKSAAGYDLTRLLLGSEGTLAIIADLTVRLHPRPEAIHAAVATFSTVTQACNAAIQSLQLGLGVARLELLDGPQIAAVNAYAKLSLRETPTCSPSFTVLRQALANTSIVSPTWRWTTAL
jgi:FAD/FMN-containing dehydrogenases